MYNKKLISSQRQIKGKLAAANGLTFYKNLVLRANPNRDKENDWMNEFVFIYCTYHISSHGGLQ